MIRFRSLTLAAVVAGTWLTLPAQTATSTPTQPEPSSAPDPSPSVPDSTQLDVIKVLPPDYPLEAAAKKLQGQVLIKVHILENGDVDRTEIVNGEPILAQAAAESMRTWKFKPYIKDGRR